MELPKIDVAQIPDLEQLTGLFGAMRTPGQDDSLIVLATIVYEVSEGGGGLI